MAGYYGEATVSKNLFKKVVTTSEYGTSIMEYSYELNDKGFPTKVIVDEVNNGVKHFITREFNCK
jgi:hypothetical protein